MRWALGALVVLVAALAYVWWLNPAVLLTPLTLTVAGWTLAATLRDIVLVLAGGWLLVWLAGLIDLGLRRREVHRFHTALTESERELARVKAEAYDRSRTVMADVQARLGAIDQEITRLSGRIEAALRVTELRSEVRS